MTRGFERTGEGGACFAGRTAKRFKLPRGIAVFARLQMAAVALTFAGCARADAPADAPPPGVPNFAVIETLDGAPADSAGGREFWTALRSTFIRPSFTTQRAATRPGEYAISVPISNRFVLLEGSGASKNPDAYRVQLTLEWLAPQAELPAAPRGMRKRSAPMTPAAPDTTAPRAFVAVFVWPPGVDPAVVRIAAASDTVTFRAPRTPSAAHGASIGRAAALLVLERLHHLSGDLAQDERLKLDQADRHRDAGGGPVRR